MISMAYRVIPQKGHLFSVEMTNLTGKCSLIPGFRDISEADAWIVQTKRMLHELDPRDRVVARAVQRSLLWWHGPGEFEMPHTDANRPVIANWWFPRRGAI